MLSSTLPLLVLGLSSYVLADVEVNFITTAPTATAVTERGILSTIAIACSTVSGLASPQPSGAICDLAAEPDGSQYIISYTTGTYTESLAACSGICLATSGCTNLYFTEGQYCNLYYSPATVLANSDSALRFYDVSCFSCPTLTTSSSSTTSITLSTSSSSSRRVSSTAVTSTSSAATSTQINSSTPIPTPWTSIQTDPALYDMAIMTTYTQPSQCTSGNITQMAYHGTNLWENDIHPVPTSTVTDCYPSQFYSSVMGAIHSVDLPAFSALICPYNWETINYNETYIVCCPPYFEINAPNYHDNTDRPFSGAVCTTDLGPSELYDIYSYDKTAFWTIYPTTAPSDGTWIRANAFDGIIATATGATTMAALAGAATSPSAAPATITPSTSVSTLCTPAFPIHLGLIVITIAFVF